MTYSLTSIFTLTSNEDYAFNIGAKDSNDNFHITFDPNPNISAQYLTPQYWRACDGLMSG